jgi:hypothetical protein
VSSDAAGTEVIVASKRSTSLLRGTAAVRALEGDTPVVGGAAPPPELGVAWPEPIEVLADLPLPGVAHRWRDADELGRLVSRPGPPAYLLIAAEPAVAFNCLGAVETSIRRAVTPIVIHGELIIVGPLFTADPWPCRHCWSRRLLANLPALGARVDRGHRVLVGETDEHRIAGCLTTARMLWEARAPGSPRDRALVVDLERGTLDPERVLPLAGCPCLHPVASGTLEDAVGRCFGTVQSVGAPAHPFGPGVTVLTARTRLAASQLGGGAAGRAVETTRRRAIAEAVERLAGETRPAGAYRSAWAALEDAPRLEELQPYTTDQYQTSGFPYRPLEPAAVLDWVDGVDLGTGRTCPVPLVTVTFHEAPPLFDAPSSTGRAAGGSWPAAVEKALLELAERDVVTRRWYEGDAFEVDAELWAPAEQRAVVSAGLALRLAACADDDVPVAVAAVADRRTGQGALGSAAGPTFASAAPHAVEEALLMYAHRWSRGSLLAVGDAWFAGPATPWPPLAPAVRPSELARRYRPVAVSLTTPEAAAAGLEVAALWSPTAIDLPRPGAPLPLARWTPSDPARRRLAAVPGAFVGGSRITRPARGGGV